MISREYLEPVGIADSIQENYLTHAEVIALVEEYAAIPYDGDYADRWTIRALQEQFQGTEFAHVLEAVPVGESIRADALSMQLDDPDYNRKHGLRSVSVSNGKLYYQRKNTEPDENYYMDWQQRATHYQLLTLKLVPDLPIADLEELDIVFHSLMPAQQFELWQMRFDSLPDLFAPPYNPHDRSTWNWQRLSYRLNQMRYFESDPQGEWDERGSLIFFHLDGAGAKERVALLKRPPIPSEFFDQNNPSEPEIHFAISAPLPTDLQIPEG